MESSWYAEGDVVGVAHRYIESDDLIVTVWHGVVTWEEWEDVARHQVRDATWSYGRRRLTDARSADTSGLTGDHADAISAIYEATGTGIGGTQLAIVANDVSTLAHNVEQSLAALRVTTYVFNSIEVACTWLTADLLTVLHAIRELRTELQTQHAPTP